MGHPNQQNTSHNVKKYQLVIKKWIEGGQSRETKKI